MVTSSATDIETQPPPFKFLGGELPLDFTNTVAWHAPARPRERFTSYAALVAWGRRAGILSEGEAEALLAEAGRHPADANAVLDRALALRATLHRVFSAAASAAPPPPADLASLNAALSEALGHLRIVYQAEGYRWEWMDGQQALARVLWPVVRAAADLLASAELERVRQCPGEGCGWLFVDRSRNQRRRWCEMAHCGNLAKVRRHRAAKTRTRS